MIRATAGWLLESAAVVVEVCRRVLYAWPMTDGAVVPVHDEAGAVAGYEIRTDDPLRGLIVNRHGEVDLAAHIGCR